MYPTFVLGKLSGLWTCLVLPSTGYNRASGYATIQSQHTRFNVLAYSRWASRRSYGSLLLREETSGRQIMSWPPAPSAKAMHMVFNPKRRDIHIQYYDGMRRTSVVDSHPTLLVRQPPDH